ncbi:MAG: DUF4143 domain-containing protein, partial [Actinomycetia bacterium]|nr:DUF4143 domain-containing protein [Actinomycetes bacterium]
AVTSLKYFYEQAPEYHLIAAGSLLGVSTGRENSFPVGKVNFITLYPMSFGEYLTAFNEEMLAKELFSGPGFKPLSDILHKKLLKHMKLYLFLGGMPEVLQDYLDNQHIVSVRQIQKEILEAYTRDFSKHTDKSQAIKTAELWHSIPYQLAKENKKFKYSAVRKNARASAFEQTIEWLRKTGLIYVVYNISVPKLPLSGYANLSKFKIYLFDTGLLGAMLDLTSDIIVKPDIFYREYNGAFIENFIATELITAGNKNLFYWTSKSDAEVDFVIQSGNEIFPIEVKSGTNRNIKSLRSYADKYKPEYIFRVSPRNFINDKDFVNIPLYAVSSINNYKSYC